MRNIDYIMDNCVFDHHTICQHCYKLKNKRECDKYYQRCAYCEFECEFFDDYNILSFLRSKYNGEDYETIKKRGQEIKKQREIDEPLEREKRKKDWNFLIPYKPKQKVYIIEELIEQHDVVSYQTEYHGVDCWGTRNFQTIIDSIKYEVKEIEFNLEFWVNNTKDIYESKEEAEKYCRYYNNKYGKKKR